MTEYCWELARWEEFGSESNIVGVNLFGKCGVLGHTQR